MINKKLVGSDNILMYQKQGGKYTENPNAAVLLAP